MELKQQNNNNNLRCNLFDIDCVDEWAYWNNALTPEECNYIINYANQYQKIQGVTFNENPLDKNVRNCNIVWLNYLDELEWLTKKLEKYVITLNNDYFKFNLYGFCEAMQFTEYIAPSGHYVKHVDRGVGIPARKLSLVLQLSDPNTYEGGNLELHTANQPVIAPKEQGKLIVFPSYTLHAVSPITKGTRYSLVMWVTGAPFK